jgi:hypothetical protein
LRDPFLIVAARHHQPFIRISFFILWNRAMGTALSAKTSTQEPFIAGLRASPLTNEVRL